MSRSSATPPGLRERIARDLARVRPLASPLRRAGWLALLAAATVALAWMRLRGEASPAGGFGLGIAAAEWAAGLAMVWIALREAVPGRGLGRGAVILALAGGLAVQLAAGFALATSIGDGWLGDGGARDGLQCARGEASVGLPLLAVAVWLLLRAFPLRARLASALAGGAAGLFADAAWHLVCTHTDLMHLVVWHFGSTVTLALAGYAAGIVVERRVERAG